MDKVQKLMSLLESGIDCHEDNYEDMGRLEEMIDRMDVDHLLALIAHICEDKAKEFEEEGNSELADAWKVDAAIVEEASKKVG